DGDLALLTAAPLAGSAAPGSGAASGLELLLGLPASPAPWYDVPGDGPLPVVARAVVAAGPWVAGALPAALAVLALLATLLGAGRRRVGETAHRVTATTVTGWLVAAAGLAVAVLAQGHGAWAGAGLSLLLLGLGAAAPAGATAFAARAARVPGAGGTTLRVAAATLVVLALVLPAAQAAARLAGSGSVAAAGRDDVLHVSATGAVPAVGQQMQAPPRQARVLEEGVDPAGDVRYALLRADGSQLADSAVAAREASSADAAAAAAADALDAAVAELVAGAGDGVPERLAALGIGAVQVRTDDTGVGDLVATLDLVPGLSRVTEGQAVSVWRVSPEDGPAPGWARLEEGGAPVQVLPSAGTQVRADLAAGGVDRVVVLAEAASRGWHATLDGHRLDRVPPEETAGLQAFAV